MTKSIILRILTFLIFSALLISCEDDNLQNEKEARLLKQYLELNNITQAPESNGMYFIQVTEGTGLKPGGNDWIVIRYTTKLLNDRVINTSDENIATIHGIYSNSVLYGDVRIPLNALLLKGVKDGLMLMREGAQATLILPSNLAYGSLGAGTVPGYTSVVYDVELIRVINDPAVFEQELIDNYIALYNNPDSIHLVIEQMESGLYYIETLAGTGDTPEETAQVSVLYSGRLTDGRVFESIIGKSPFKFNLEQDETIAGFKEAILLMKKGGKSRILVPSAIGYGAIGSEPKIVGYTPLVFDLELVDIQ